MTTQPKPAASLAEALAALQANMPVVAKHASANVVKDGRKLYDYAYAPGEDITPKVYPLMSALGLSFTAQPTIEGDRFVLDYQLLHTCGDSIDGAYPLPDPQRLGPQDLGKAITYARRYALCALIGLFPGGDDTDTTSDGQPIAEPSRLPRNVPDAQLAGEGRMTRGQKSAHEQLEADTKRGNGTKADRVRPRGPDPDSDPWATDEPVTGERARQLRAHLDRNAQPEDQPGSIMPGQHRAIEAQLGMLGFKREERADRHAHAALRLGLDRLPAQPGSNDDPSMLGLSAAQAAELIRALQDDLDDLKKAETADA